MPVGTEHVMMQRRNVCHTLSREVLFRRSATPTLREKRDASIDVPLIVIWLVILRTCKVAALLSSPDGPSNSIIPLVSRLGNLSKKQGLPPELFALHPHAGHACLRIKKKKWNYMLTLDHAQDSR